MVQTLTERLSLYVIAALMTGCATFHPKPLVPAQRASAFESRTLVSPGLKAFLEAQLHRELAPWPPTAWDFPTLLLVACYYHPELDVARAHWQLAEAGVITAGARPNPAAGVGPQYNADAGNGVSPWILGFTLDVPLEMAGKRGLRLAQARHLAEAGRLQVASAAWQVRSRLRARLLDLYAAGQSETLLKRQQILQEEIASAMARRLDAGESAQPEVAQERLALDRLRLSGRAAQKQEAEARARLAEALGVPASALEGQEISFADLTQFPTDLPPRELQRQALHSRPDLLQALAEYAATQSALQLEVARQYPDIHLGPGYAWDQGADKWAVGFAVELPIFNRHQGPIAEARARCTEAAARFNALQAQAIGEADRTLAGILAALQALQAADSLVADSQRQEQAAAALFSSGEADRLALLRARLELGDSERSRQGALVEAQQSLGLLEDALHYPLGPRASLPVLPEQNPRQGEEREP